MPWKKGQSGNPKGAPRTRSIRELLIKQYGPNAEGLVAKLRELSECENQKVQLSATELLLAYHSGRPTQSIDMSIKPEPLVIAIDDGQTT